MTKKQIRDWMRYGLWVGYLHQHPIAWIHPGEGLVGGHVDSDRFLSPHTRVNTRVNTLTNRREQYMCDTPYIPTANEIAEICAGSAARLALIDKGRLLK